MVNEDEPESQNQPALPPGDGEPAEGSTYEGLDPRQENAITVLLREPTLKRAATLIGVHERTLSRWLGDPTFKRAYHAARRDAFGHAIGLTQHYAPLAVNTLAKVMNDPQTPPGVKVAAAMGLLRFGRDGIELDDLAERVESLEAAAAEQAKAP